MTFGPWIRQEREKQGLQVQRLAELSGVSSPTVSRIEHELVQPTVCTAVRICRALAISLDDLITNVEGVRPAHDAYEEEATKGWSVLSVSDVDDFLRLFDRDFRAALQLLADALNNIVELWARRQQDFAREHFSAIEVYRILNPTVIYSFDLHYPEFPTGDYLEIYRLGGALTNADLGSFVTKVRGKGFPTLNKLEKETGISDSKLSRLQTGDLDQIKLGDLLKVDRALGQQGRLLKMAERVCELAIRIKAYPSEGAVLPGKLVYPEKLYKLSAETLIKIYRWRQEIVEDNRSWLNELRSQLREK